MYKVGLTEHIDLALVMLYIFWGFFACLIWELHRENKREGYPLVTDRRDGRVQVVGFPAPPPPKTYLLPQGGTATLPNDRRETGGIRVGPTGGFSGPPFEPTGDPMLDGVGPASYAERDDHPDVTIDNLPKIVPLRAAPGYFVAERDPDPRGFDLVGGDRGIAGRITDVWVDRSEFMVRYYEAEVPTRDGARRVLVPVNFCRVNGERQTVTVRALYAGHFAAVPGIASSDQVTMLEEDKIV